MYTYRLLETDWGIVAYVAQDDKLVRFFLPSDLPGLLMTKTREKRQISTQIAAINGFGRQHKVFPEHDPDLLPRLADQVRYYFAGKQVRFEFKVNLSKLTPFTRKVLEATAKIPYGQTVSYQAVAKRVGAAQACRAVGQALGANPIPLVIPCHRVVRRNGRFGGFTGPCGVAMKIRMLELEKRSHE